MRTTIVAMVVVVLGLGALAPGRSEAGADADVTKAFQQFVHGVAAGKAQPPELELFLTPDDDTADPGVLRAMLAAPKVKVRQVMVSAGGRSAWLAAEIPVRRTIGGKKPKADVLRASAFLVFDGAAWTVRATHWSFAVKNAKDPGCGSIDPGWVPEPGVPAALLPTVKRVLAVLDENSPPSFVALMSDDKRSLVFGSAPRETFAGGAKIKGVFKRWSVSLPWFDDEERAALPVMAGVGPDDELSWMALGVAYVPLCVNYRTLFVLAKEPAGWRIVHQHYSEPVDDR